MFFMIFYDFFMILFIMFFYDFFMIFLCFFYEILGPRV